MFTEELPEYRVEQDSIMLLKHCLKVLTMAKTLSKTRHDEIGSDLFWLMNFATSCV